MNTNVRGNVAFHTNKQQYHLLHKSATQIQSQWRGHRIRKTISEWAMKEFESMVMEIEGKDADVIWNSSKSHALPMPQVSNTKLSEDEHDLDKILSSFVNKNERVSSTGENYQIDNMKRDVEYNQVPKQGFSDHKQLKQKEAQLLFEEKLKEHERVNNQLSKNQIQDLVKKPQVSNTSMNTSMIEDDSKITREQEIQTENMRASLNAIDKTKQSNTRRLVTVSTNTSIAFDGIPKIQDQKSQDLSIEIPLEDSQVQSSQEDISDMLNESDLMMSNLEMLKSFDFGEMKRSADSLSSSSVPTFPQQNSVPSPLVNQPALSSQPGTVDKFKPSPNPSPRSSISSISSPKQSLRSSLKNNTFQPKNSTSSSVSSDDGKLVAQQQRQAKQELQQEISLLRYEISLNEEAYTRRKMELIEERKRSHQPQVR